MRKRIYIALTALLFLLSLAIPAAAYAYDNGANVEEWLDEMPHLGDSAWPFVVVLYFVVSFSMLALSITAIVLIPLHIRLRKRLKSMSETE
jgi:uncharacterized membrane protein YdjX (TVP38/TMEM64 family)